MTGLQLENVQTALGALSYLGVHSSGVNRLKLEAGYSFHLYIMQGF
jgi:hypothetical protein